MKTRDEIIEELKENLPWTSKDRGGILTIDQLREFIETAEYEGEPIDPEQFLEEEMRWGYCGKCRQILDGGYCDFSEKEYQWLKDSGGDRGDEMVNRMKAYKRKHPNCKAVCWDCLDAYEEENEEKEKMFGLIDLDDVNDYALRRLLEKCEIKTRLISSCRADIEKEMTRRNIKKAKEKSRKEWEKWREKHGDEGEIDVEEV